MDSACVAPSLSDCNPWQRGPFRPCRKPAVPKSFRFEPGKEYVYMKVSKQRVVRWKKALNAVLACAQCLHHAQNKAMCNQEATYSLLGSTLTSCDGLSRYGRAASKGKRKCSLLPSKWVQNTAMAVYKNIEYQGKPMSFAGCVMHFVGLSAPFCAGEWPRPTQSFSYLYSLFVPYQLDHQMCMSCFFD